MTLAPRHSRTVTVTITGTNDSPVVTTAAGEDAGTVAESGDLSAIAEAGLGGKLEPTAVLDAAVEAALSGGLPADQAAMQGLISSLMTGQGIDEATAIAVLWDNFDDKYITYNNVQVNTAFVLLGVEYASYVKAGGSPLLDVTAKYTVDGADSGTAPDRLQSMHDNLLGNLSMASLTDRGLTALEPLVQAVDPDLLTRAYYSGDETDGGLAAGARLGYGQRLCAHGQRHAEQHRRGRGFHVHLDRQCDGRLRHVRHHRRRRVDLHAGQHVGQRPGPKARLPPRPSQPR